MTKVAIIGAGITGITTARMLSGNADVVVFEREASVGGLIRCKSVEGALYHLVGGHVFNTRSPVIADWFWKHFAPSEFRLITRNAKILMGDKEVGYPIENHLYQLGADILKPAIRDLVEIAKRGGRPACTSFGEFLEGTFGETLCRNYFYPYNEKIWRTNLNSIPVEWLEGKLPMPSVEEIITANVQRKEETAIVHARFHYPVAGGSQFVIDRLAEGVDVRLSRPFNAGKRDCHGKWRLDCAPGEEFDAVVYTGDVRRFSECFETFGEDAVVARLRSLRTRGITNVLCESNRTDTSWLYLPSRALTANRVIYTGGFSSSNNGDRSESRITCTVEYNYGEQEQNIQRDLAAIPGGLRVIDRNDAPDAYVIQERDTREAVNSLKAKARGQGIYLAGRFAEWEYYNMDKAMEAAARTVMGMGFTASETSVP